MRDPRPQGLLFDLDGVLYDDREAIPGAARTVNWAREVGLPYLFVTNTTSRPRGDLVKKLARFGIPATPEQIWTPLTAARQWLQSQPPGKLALFVREGAREEFADLSQVSEYDEAGADYVVIGDLGRGWDFEKLNRAFRLLHSNSDAQLVALGMTRYWQAPDGVSLDVAPFVAALEHATDRRAVVLGKPARPFFQSAADRLGLPPAALLMIGDDVRSDVGGAQAAGLRGALVKTGKFRPQDLQGDVRPALTLDSIADLREALEGAGATPSA